MIGAFMRALEFEVLPVLLLYCVAMFTVSLILPALIFLLLTAGGMVFSIIGYTGNSPLFKLIGRGSIGCSGLIVLICSMASINFAKLFPNIA